ncbi:autotransporter outer membrane beta-barrel domain-containing protein [Aquabacter cavernae]|uniref:autotransporter outer membrane beta-barrel domain-containing protein n=1 Tax=Aquabacter cavernae TaxID=2496029 RepID=UPI000F8CA47D|nr:autotransporter outer membrane beta-barrel domain-containing protein [Aquabacter cavernae]
MEVGARVNENRPLTRKRIGNRAQALLCGVSVAVLLQAGAARADNTTCNATVCTVSVGANGENGASYIIITTLATPGLPGDPVSDTIDYDVLGAAGTAIQLGSVGGRGGNGAYAFSTVAGAQGGDGGAISLTLSGAVSGGSDQTSVTPLVYLYSIGGNGGYGFGRFGKGGEGGAVTLDLTSSVTATGKNSPAIYMLSQGGEANYSRGASTGGTDEDGITGDHGGNAGAITATIGAQALVSTAGAMAPVVIASSEGGLGGTAGATLGGSYYGSVGGNGGTVTVSNDGILTSTGSNSSGLVLQSVGGAGGGSSGNAFGVGQAGQAGGWGGVVSGTNTGSITTAGDYSFGLVAQSVGGVGGKGGNSTFFDGGDGGAAGTGGVVEITHSGAITTQGTGASAIVVQSVGGGNAIDAFSVSETVVHTSGGGDGGKGGLFGSGGTGGSGGAGGNVTVNNSGSVLTMGDQAYGILLQSIGGGGGTGGANITSGAFLAVALGGDGGSGGDAADVTFNGTGGDLSTFGSEATGVIAQSVGGTGGQGGYASAGSVGVVLSVSVSTGGAGGDGGKGGSVTVDNATSITTFGDTAMGLNALSVGGGGGTGGDSNALAIALPLYNPEGGSPPSISFAMATGGSGGTGGAGGSVTLSNAAQIRTYGVGGTGILAQSVGGGGGTSGNAVAYSLSVSAPDSGAFSMSDSIGGSGGSGGAGGSVSLTNTGTVQTWGNTAFGLQAQSVGGGGGDGGSATATADAISFQRSIVISASVGGSGGSGGAGNGVKVQQEGTVVTLGTGAAGVLAQSVGGGGGNGGAATVSAAQGLSFNDVANELVKFLPLGDSVSITKSVGGSGGDGGSGGTVNVVTTAGSAITTYGAGAEGILAQSVGGGGGSGGDNIVSASGTFSYSLSVGGSGASGGAAGRVSVTQAGTITTMGDGAHGIFAQSVGGGGGRGGSLSSNTSDTPDSVAELWAALKKAVGIGNYEAWAASTGNTDTKAALDQFIADIQDADAYPELNAAYELSDFLADLRTFKTSLSTLSNLAQGKLPTPTVAITVSVGGNGGDGITGSDVTVINTGTIGTWGDVAHGIFGQSVGGGGGQGGGAYGAGSSTLNFNNALGGNGGGGASGGKVTITNSAEVTTYGRTSYGILGQSIGGGGGLGGSGLSAQTITYGADLKTLSLSASLNQSIGGISGTGGNGGTVTLTNYAPVTTFGSEAHGVVAQSVGGGGGIFLTTPYRSTAGTSGTQSDETVSVATLLALLKSAGIEDLPVITLSGSADGPALAGATTVLGGASGVSGYGGEVLVYNYIRENAYSGKQTLGTITTHGEAAFGIFAQSVGGGGGFVNSPGSAGENPYVLAYGGGSGKGAELDLFLGDGSSITTYGANAMGIVAQSVGGGGGYGGASVLAGETVPVIGSIHGTSSGDGGRISISSVTNDSGLTAAITTYGARAHGIFAQSVGGGGGLVATPFGTDTRAQTALTQLSGTLTALVASAGGSSTLDASMDQIPASLQNYARLLGSGTTTLDTAVSNLANLSSRSSASGTGQWVDISFNGDITTYGADAYAIFAQSGRQTLDGSLDPTVKGGSIDITTKGIVSGGSGTGAAIGVDGGKTNDITVSGGSLSALSGTAVRSSFGIDQLSNSGQITGDIDLAVGNTTESNSFQNTSSGTYISNVNGSIRLSGDGGAGTFTNAGSVNIAGTGIIGALTISNGTTTLGGSLLVDVSTPAAGAALSDVLVAGDVKLNGVAIKPQAVDSLLPGTFTVVTASSLSTTKAATVEAASGSPISWTATTSDKTVTITPSATFVASAGSNLSRTQVNFLNSLQTAWNTGNAGASSTFAGMANAPSQAAYRMMVDSYGVSEAQGQPAAIQTLAARGSLGAAMSCPSFEGSGTLIQETQCVWSRVTANRMTLGEGAGSEGFTQSGVSYRMGGQWEIMPDLFLGGSAAFTTSTLNASDGLSATSGTGGDVSVALKYQLGPWLFAGTLHGGYGKYDSTNMFYFGNNAWSMTDDNSVWTGGLRLRAAYEMAFETWYLRPYVDLDILYTNMSAYDFEGGGLMLRADPMRQWGLALGPAVELGARIELDEKSWLRVFGTVGGIFLSESSLDTNVWVAVGNEAGFGFTSSSELPQVLLDLGAGVQFMAHDKYELRGEYKAQVADEFLNQELSLRFSSRF